MKKVRVWHTWVSCKTIASSSAAWMFCWDRSRQTHNTRTVGAHGVLNGMAATAPKRADRAPAHKQCVLFSPLQESHDIGIPGSQLTLLHSHPQCVLFSPFPTYFFTFPFEVDTDLTVTIDSFDAQEALHGSKSDLNPECIFLKSWRSRRWWKCECEWWHYSMITVPLSPSDRL